MEKKILDFCKKHQLIQNDSTIIVGVSGGADSMALLFFLNRLKAIHHLNIVAVHLNHQMRGEEADKDTALVEKFCEENNIPYKVAYKDIPNMAKSSGQSEEEVGRNQRYQLFNDVLESFGKGTIAVAHHLDDQTETILHHLVRGCGLEGLRGMLPKQNHIIRPFLCIDKSEIMSYIATNNVPYRLDESNLTSDYTRNKIRNQVIPILSEINPKLNGAIQRLSDIILEQEQFLNTETEKALMTSTFVNQKSWHISILTFHSFSLPLQRNVIRKVVQTVKGSLTNIEAKHIQQVIQLTEMTGNKEIHLPCGVRGKKEYDKLIIEIPNDSEMVQVNQIVLKKGENRCFQDWIVHIDYFDSNDLKNIQENKYTKYFDYDKMVGTLIFRTRLSGDYFSYGSEKHRKKLKEYMIDEKISKTLREQIPVVALNSHVIWVVGYVKTAEFEVDSNTKKIVEIKIIQEDKNARNTRSTHF